MVVVLQGCFIYYQEGVIMERAGEKSLGRSRVSFIFIQLMFSNKNIRIPNGHVPNVKFDVVSHLF